MIATTEDMKVIEDIPCLMQCAILLQEEGAS